MDPLTHTLVGANLAATRLGQTTRLAAPALIIGANLPDIDAFLYFNGNRDFALEFRRGWTHGILALLVLPLVQTGLLLLYARLRGRGDAGKGGRGESDLSPRLRVPASLRPGWLLALSALAVLTHPSLDWLNTYGMRWLMPFDGRWSYGDSVYIMDPWLWLVLGCGLLLGKRPTPLLIVTFLLITFAIARVVGGRSPGYLFVVAFVALILFLTLLWRPPAFSSRVPAVALLISFTYIAARIAINEATESRVARELGPVRRVMAAPHPLDPTRWDVVAQLPNAYRFGRYSWRSRLFTWDLREVPVPRNSTEYAVARRDSSVRGFITWVRFPWYEVERTPTETRVHIRDARRLRLGEPVSSGGVTVVLPRQ